jgi:hypothetical protein
MPRKNKIIKYQKISIEKLSCNKRRFRNEREAINAAEIQMLENPRLGLSVYKCDLCAYWHLTRSAKDYNL